MPPSLCETRRCRLLVVLAVLACDASPSPVAAPTVDAASPDAAGPVASATFDPQPEPPGGVYRFAMSSFPLQSAARGSYAVCGGQGAVDVRPVSSTRAGQLVQVTQSWSFLGPACRATTAARCAPSLAVTLRGTMNALTGAVVLDGTTEKGVRVHVNARVSGVGGVGGVAGEVMFNPQPDPPKVCVAVG